ncbi:protein of unknown function [Pseudorhizobium banfieldiae]|uniref:Uncharacterized protein n=1 Tax=Pseudorhizobium banfieldiae TaxID=1125847 RepID=L0NE59_9HYPH|nr:hypothetical protein [Pseudorhizobium banfieldiae]CAD6605902.1 hypothetical protein RNT25_01745 [arsenite-oxidising bacterium NT-25]CCF19091.1 protein of unknown function [Pseudorhizobium banfieldiae]
MRQDFKKGDIVSVQAELKYGSDSMGNVTLSFHGYQTVTIDQGQVSMVRPFWVKDDKAVYEGPADSPEHYPKIEVTVLATSEDLVWIKTPAGKTNVVFAIDLQRIEEKHGTEE